jgi:hypothetical protein
MYDDDDDDDDDDENMINDDDFGFLKVVAFFENDEFSTRPDESLSQ